MSGYTALARLVDPARLRAALLALRRDAGEYDPPDSADLELIEVAERPFESPADAHDRLARLEERLRERADRRAVFLTVYTRMTREVREGVEAGGFADPGWMRDYLVSFANYYRRAFLAFERGRLADVPEPWRVAFGTALDGDALVAQDAFLGINAHINHDLALALHDVGVDPNRSLKYADHRAINDVLARLVDAQQEALAELYAPGIADVDASLGRLDEALSLFSLVEGREQAWRVAVVMTDVGWSPAVSYARWVLRATATGGALFVLSPSLDPGLLRELRRIETERVGVAAVLERLREAVDEAGDDPLLVD